MKFYLNNKQQGLLDFRNAWFKCLDGLNAGKQFEVEIKYKKRSNEQSEKYHSMIGDIAKQAQHLGAKWSAEDWKRLLVDQYLREVENIQGKVVPNLDGTGIVQLGFQTRKFTKEQASEFVEWLYMWAANNGIDLA